MGKPTSGGAGGSGGRVRSSEEESKQVMRPPPPEVLWSRMPLYEEYADESDTGWEKFFANPDAPDYEGWAKFIEELDKKYRFENYYFQDYLVAIMNAKQGGYLVED